VTRRLQSQGFEDLTRVETLSFIDNGRRQPFNPELTTASHLPATMIDLTPNAERLRMALERSLNRPEKMPEA
jgi:hypothetical protein